MLCGVCQIRRPVHHTTTVTESVTRSCDLCEECWQATCTHLDRELAASVRSARCYLCAGQVNVGGTDPLAKRLGVDRSRFFCFRCSPVYSQCVAGVISAIPSDLAEGERAALLAKLTDEVDRQARQILEGLRGRAG